MSASARVQWRATLALARRVAADPDVAVEDFAHDLKWAERTRFAVEGYTVEHARRAFIDLGKATIHAGLPAYRAAYAAALAACAACLETILDEDASRASAGDRRIMGEVD